MYGIIGEYHFLLSLFPGRVVTRRGTTNGFGHHLVEATKEEVEAVNLPLPTEEMTAARKAVVMQDGTKIFHLSILN